MSFSTVLITAIAKSTAMGTAMDTSMEKDIMGSQKAYTLLS